LWLDPNVHVGPAPLAAFLASIWYLGKRLFGTSSGKLDGMAFAASLATFIIGLGVIYLINTGHSDEYTATDGNYNLLMAATLPLVLSVTFWSINKGLVEPIIPKENVIPIVGFIGLTIFCVGAHATGTWEFPQLPSTIEPSNAVGRAAALLIGGRQGVGEFAAGGLLESVFAVAAANCVPRYFGFAIGPKQKPP